MMQRRAEADFSRLPFTIYLLPPRLFAITERRGERGGSLSRFNSRLKPWIGLSTIDRRRNVFDELAKNSRPDRVSIYEPLYTDRWITLIASSFPLPSRLPFPTRYTRLFSNFVHRGRSIIDSRFLFFSFFLFSLSLSYFSLVTRGVRIKEKDRKKKRKREKERRLLHRLSNIVGTSYDDWMEIFIFFFYRLVNKVFFTEQQMLPGINSGISL